MVSNNSLFHSQNYPSLDNKLYGNSNQKAHQKKSQPILFLCFLTSVLPSLTFLGAVSMAI